MTEADLLASPLKQRERLMLGALIDLREVPKNCPLYPAHTVTLLGGPYDGRRAVVNTRQRDAWVIGDFSYALVDGVWTWTEVA
jgi:hypothetical protein